MIGSITRAKLVDHVVAVTSYLLTSAGTAALAWSMVGLIGGILPEHGAKWAFLSGLCVIMALREAGCVRLVLPSRYWQVPSAWVRDGSLKPGAIWGSLLGPGFLTHQHYPVYHIALLWVLFTGSLQYGAIAGLVFGLSRSLPSLLTLPSRTGMVQRMMVIMSTQMTIAHRAAVPFLGGASVLLLAGRVF